VGRTGGTGGRGPQPTEQADQAQALVHPHDDVAVIPIQDLLVFDDGARMNDPSTFVGNWSWRMPPTGQSVDLADSVRGLAQRYGRVRG